MKEFTDDDHCFVCGERNAAGLKLRFDLDPAGTSRAPLCFAAHLQGWRETVHGGLLATVLDEAMIKAAGAAGRTCVTAELTVKYRQPAPTGAALEVTGCMRQDRGRLILAESSIRDASGRVLAQATGKLFKV